MSNPFNKLTDFNHSQVRKYLNFFRNKRQSSLRALSSEFSDLKHDRYISPPPSFFLFTHFQFIYTLKRFGDSMYSKEDVEEALDFLQSAVNVIFYSKLYPILDITYNIFLESYISRYGINYQYGSFNFISTVRECSR